MGKEAAYSPNSDRVCMRCKAAKRFSDFYKKGERWDAWCRPCRLASKKNSYQPRRSPQPSAPAEIPPSTSPHRDRNADTSSGIPVLNVPADTAQDSVSLESSKECSACGITKPLSEFYLKGVRSESACKECKRQARRDGYSSKKDDAEINAILAIANFIGRHELTELKAFNQRFEEFLTKCDTKRKSRS